MSNIKIKEEKYHISGKIPEIPPTSVFRTLNGPSGLLISIGDKKLVVKNESWSSRQNDVW